MTSSEPSAPVAFPVGLAVIDRHVAATIARYALDREKRTVRVCLAASGAAGAALGITVGVQTAQLLLGGFAGLFGCVTMDFGVMVLAAFRDKKAFLDDCVGRGLSAAQGKVLLGSYLRTFGRWPADGRRADAFVEDVVRHGR